MNSSDSGDAEGQGGSTLILTRRINESLTIGTEITVVVLEVKGRRVRFGIGVPEDMAVLPQEIIDKIRREKPSHGGS